MERLLPRENIYRPKEGFSIPIKHWLRRELRELMLDHLSEKRIEEAGISALRRCGKWSTPTWRAGATSATSSGRCWFRDLEIGLSMTKTDLVAGVILKSSAAGSPGTQRIFPPERKPGAGRVQPREFPWTA